MRWAPSCELVNRRQSNLKYRSKYCTQCYFSLFIDLSLQLWITNITSNQSTENYWSVTNLCELVATNSHSTRCRPYFGVRILYVSNRMKRSNLQKRYKTHPVLGCAGERISLRCRQVTHKIPKTVKNFFVLQFCSCDGSFRHGEMKIWVCLDFQHVTRYIGTDFVEERRQKIQRSEKEHFFHEGCFDRKEYISNTANKRCSRQVLELRCSWWYSIQFYTWREETNFTIVLSPERWNIDMLSRRNVPSK